MRERLISEEIHPVAGSFDMAGMAAGEVGLCERFVWRGEEHAVAELLETWKQLSPRFSPGEDRYLRRHWFRIRTRGGLEMKLYFERQGRPGAKRRSRWFIYTLLDDEESR
jgi:hypothetical protein